MPSELPGGGEGQATSQGVAGEDLKGSNFEERGDQCSGQKNWQRQGCVGLASAGRGRRCVWLAPGNTRIMSFTWLQRLLPGVPCHRLHSIHRLSLVFAPRRSEQAARHESPRGRAMLGTPLTCYPSTCSSPKSPRSGSQGAPPVAGSFVMHPGEAWLSASPTDPISSDWYYRCDLGEMVFFSFHFPGQRPSLLFVK